MTKQENTLIRKDDGHNVFVETQDEPICLVIQEYMPMTFDDIVESWKESSISDTHICNHIGELLLQIAEGLHAMETEWGLHHNDLHLGNIVAVKSKNHNSSLEWRIIDWGRSTCSRDGCHSYNSIYMKQGLAYGQHKTTEMPLEPVSHTKYHGPVSGGDMVCLIIMLLRETYIQRALKGSTLETILYPWIPKPEIKGDGLHVFKQANDWAKRYQLSMSSLIYSLREFVKKVPSVSPPNLPSSELNIDEN
jgi:hypothetical protein